MGVSCTFSNHSKMCQLLFPPVDTSSPVSRCALPPPPSPSPLSFRSAFLFNVRFIVQLTTSPLFLRFPFCLSFLAGAASTSATDSWQSAGRRLCGAWGGPPAFSHVTLRLALYVRSAVGARANRKLDERDGCSTSVFPSSLPSPAFHFFLLFFFHIFGSTPL